MLQKQTQPLNLRDHCLGIFLKLKNRKVPLSWFLRLECLIWAPPLTIDLGVVFEFYKYELKLPGPPTGLALLALL